MASPASNTVKCGEIFVTNDGDKWTFFCSYCQIYTNDIGVFICHIRLDHLNGQGSQQQKQNIQIPPDLIETRSVPLGSKPVSPIFNIPNQDGEEIQSKLVKEEYCVSYTISAVPESTNSNKIASKSSLTTPQIKEEPFLSEDSQQLTLNKETIPVVCTNEEGDDIYKCDNSTNAIVINNDYSAEERTKVALYSDLSDENDYGASGVKILHKAKTKAKSLLSYRCQYCFRCFKSVRGLHFHKTQVHDEKYSPQLPYKCKICKKCFETYQTLKEHIIAH